MRTLTGLTFSKAVQCCELDSCVAASLCWRQDRGKASAGLTPVVASVWCHTRVSETATVTTVTTTWTFTLESSAFTPSAITMYENMEAGFSFYKCSERCRGFLTDQEQRKVWGVGILYLLGFPILCCMTVIGALEVRLTCCHNQSIITRLTF